MKKFNFDYDEENDDLFVYSERKKSSGSVELGNFILDFDENGDLTAMEILDASEVLSKILSKIVEISKIKEIKIEIINFRNIDAITFSMYINNKEEKANILIPHIRHKSHVLSY